MVIGDVSRCGLGLLVALAAMVAGCSARPGIPAAVGGTAVLSCRDAAGQQAADPQVQAVNGVESIALRGDTNVYDSLPALRTRDGHRYLIWKTFLAVAASARPYRVVTVRSPANARLFYAAPPRWGALSGGQAKGAPPQRVRLAVCGQRYTGYTGGILVARPACVTLSVSGPDSRAAMVTVPVLVARC